MFGEGADLKVEASEIHTEEIQVLEQFGVEVELGDIELVHFEHKAVGLEYIEAEHTVVERIVLQLVVIIH